MPHRAIFRPGRPHREHFTDNIRADCTAPFSCTASNSGTVTLYLLHPTPRAHARGVLLAQRPRELNVFVILAPSVSFTLSDT